MLHAEYLINHFKRLQVSNELDRMSHSCQILYSRFLEINQGVQELIKMSSEFTRDKDGFLKCKVCPRRFLTEIGFENHLSNEHQNVMETKIGEN